MRISWLRSAVGERKQWSGGGEKRIVKRSRRATPAANRRRKPAAAAANAIAARDERADLRSGTGVVEGQQGDGQPVERSKPRVGHGG